MRPAWAHCDVHYLTSVADYAADLEPGARLHLFKDASRWNKLGLLRMALRVLWILVKVRPGVVVSTGAAAGYFALRFGKLCGARTIWVDSIANAEQLSMGGLLVRRYADHWLTQWPELASSNGPRWEGSIL
jgi:hypothetical protein